MDEKQYLVDLINDMRPGQRLLINSLQYYRCFVVGFLNPYADTPDDVLMNSVVGSAWGSISIRHNRENGSVLIEKHECDDKRVYESPDRRHLFTKDDDGYLVSATPSL